jgi:hypothetical protein
VKVEAQSPWYDNISKEIISVKSKLDKGEIRKYKPDMLLHVARKVDKFSPTCRTCQRYQGDIKKLAAYLKDLPGLSADDDKDYFKKGNIIGDHLQAQHKLIMEGRNFGWGAVIGAAIGGMTGWAADYLIIALPLGLALGCLGGWLWESKARKEGKTI